MKKNGILNTRKCGVNTLIIEYGSYAHGSIAKLGNINSENLKGNNNDINFF